MKVYVSSLILILIIQVFSMEEKRIDFREMAKNKEEMEVYIRDTQLNHKFNQAVPYTEEWTSLMKELFHNQVGENTLIFNELTVVLPKNVTIGSGCTIMNGVVMMGAGGITIENNVLIGAQAKLISNNHDVYDRAVLTVKPVLIKEGAWIGAGVSVLPGVTVGKYAVVGANSVVTKDIPDYAVAVGIPAKVVKYLDPLKFK
jgi:acetyltransferase-like isoleucine patch superfamily enzyme